MILVKKKYEHYVNINTEINYNNNDTYNLYTVYFINCLINNNYYDWLINQIEIIKGFDSTIYIVATISQMDEPMFKQKVLKLFPHLRIYIECYYDNEFEYRGILKVWQLGQVHKNKNDIILYFHSKGLTHFNSYDNNRNDDYNIILQDIDKIKEIFTIFPKIDKIGFFSGGIGWIWCNFWYARGSYINKVECPLKTTRRHYYEDWLCRIVEPGDEYCKEERSNVTYYKNTLENCYGFYTDKNNVANIGSYFNADHRKMYNIYN